MNIPSATYRLQFNGQFRFADAEKLMPYLRDLGVSHVYASPLLTARKGSVHGYDVTNPHEINPEIGTPEEFERFITCLHEHGLRLLLDIVPNHMAASLENPWWRDVLANGEQSVYASFFDIDWTAGAGKVLLPILTQPYGDSLESGAVRVEGKTLVCNDARLPLRNLNGVPANIDELDRLLAAQAYRLSHWRKAADAINYRRFFDVNDLIGMCAERDEVFAATHGEILDLVARGRVDGLRIDHIDGLRDPKAYLDRLPRAYIVVEKILGGGEAIPDDWRTCGTTGYDFMNIVNGAFVDERGYAALYDTYRSSVAVSDARLSDVARERKRRAMDELFATEIDALSGRLGRIAADHRVARDLPRREIRDALIALTSCLPVYRTYIRDFTIRQSDRACLEGTLEAAAGLASDNGLRFLREVLLLEPPHYLSHRRNDYLEFTLRWQQFSGAVMAKGLEDTAFYVFNPLISINDVGGDAVDPSVYFGVDAFHRRNQERQARQPATMNATSTHDTKRSEDVRARINVLSEMPERWQSCLARWSRWNRSDGAPDRNEQIFIYQTLLGAWPITRARFQGYLIKALREAKTNTSWLHPDERHEAMVLQFVDRILDPDVSRRFLKDFLKLYESVAFFGTLNSLSQVVLKVASPGVPDFYQGLELWDYSAADPDNRRPVDFELRMEMLKRLPEQPKPAELLREWRDGRVKMYTTQKALGFRREHQRLFIHGEYIPLEVTGTHAENVIAFGRRLADEWLIAAVPRLCSRLTRVGKPPLGRRVWADTSLVLPADCPRVFQDVLTGRRIKHPGRIAAIFSELPFAILSPPNLI
jgi:(1->4)-alpha-D-glucan 1-alpha-D-glucosylmutase